MRALPTADSKKKGKSFRVGVGECGGFHGGSAVQRQTVDDEVHLVGTVRQAVARRYNFQQKTQMILFTQPSQQQQYRHNINH